MNERQTKFCLNYAKDGNAYKAYCDAGYDVKSEAGAMASSSKLLRNAKVIAKLAELSKKAETKAIASISEVKEFWSSIMQSDEEETPHRIKAGELLVKVQGGFIDKIEHSGTIIKRKVIVNPSKDKDKIGG